MMKLTVIAGFAALALSACAPQGTLETYRPVVDPGAKNNARYYSDLNVCYGVAKQAEANYRSQRGSEAAGRVVTGAVTGALVGAALGNSDWAKKGAAVGAISGLGSTDFEQATGGPRRIVDRCMAQRGHVILSDFGRG